MMTFADALVFLLAVPVAEGFEYLREIGMIPTLLALPWSYQFTEPRNLAPGSLLRRFR